MENDTEIWKKTAQKTKTEDKKRQVYVKKKKRKRTKGSFKCWTKDREGGSSNKQGKESTVNKTARNIACILLYCCPFVILLSTPFDTHTIIVSLLSIST